MTLLSLFRSIYALDTLDTRFTSSSSTPYKAIVDSRTDPALPNSSSSDEIPQGVPVGTGRKSCPLAQPSKWNTPEFYFYYFIFLTMVPYMFWIAYDVSRREWSPSTVPYLSHMLTCNTASDPNYHKYQHLLSDGWVPGRKIVRQDPPSSRGPMLTMAGQLRCSVPDIPQKHSLSGRPSRIPSSSPTAVRKAAPNIVIPVSPRIEESKWSCRSVHCKWRGRGQVAKSCLVRLCLCAHILGCTARDFGAQGDSDTVHQFLLGNSPAQTIRTSRYLDL